MEVLDLVCLSLILNLVVCLVKWICFLFIKEIFNLILEWVVWAVDLWGNHNSNLSLNLDLINLINQILCSINKINLWEAKILCQIWYRIWCHRMFKINLFLDFKNYKIKITLEEGLQMVEHLNLSLVFSNNQMMVH